MWVIVGIGYQAAPAITFIGGNAMSLGMIAAVNQAPTANIGIGNSTGKTRDWTFVSNAGSYTSKRLRILVHPAP